MADFLDEKLAEIDNRLNELRPLHEEYLKLERARAALAGMDAPAAAPRAAPGRRQDGAPVRRRRRRGGTRGEQALEVVRQNPGIRVSELAERLKVDQPNYLYRVMANLQTDGAVRREGRGYVAT